MNLNLVRNFQRPVNLASYVSFAPLAAWERLLVTFVASLCMASVITRGANEQVALKWRAGNIPNQLCPFHLVGLIVSVVKAISVSAAIVVRDLQGAVVVAACGTDGRWSQSGTGNKDVHGETPNSGGVQHTHNIPSYSAHARPKDELFSQLNTIWPLLLGKCQQTTGENNPVAAHFSGQNATVAAELKNPFLGQSENCGSFGGCANQIKCGLCHSQQHSGVAA